MFLVGDKRADQEEFIKRFLHVLYDWKLDVGHSVRRVGDCLPSSTTTSSRRPPCWKATGSPAASPLFQHFQESFLRAVRGGGKRWFIQTKQREWQTAAKNTIPPSTCFSPTSRKAPADCAISIPSAGSCL
jgi:UTP:GlnB (protein PII) uridylyltransferase